MAFQEVLETYVKVNMDTKGFDKGAKQSSEFLKGFQDRINSFKADKMKLGIGQIEEKLVNLRKELKQTEDKETRIRIRGDVAGLKRELTVAQRELRNFSERADSNLTGVGARMQQIGATIKDQFMKLGGLFLGLFAGQQILKFVNDIDQARVNIVKLTGATGDVLKGLQSDALQVSKQVPQSLSVVGDAIGAVNTRFGVTGEGLQSLTRDFLDFSRITGNDVKNSVRVVSRLMGDRNIGADRTTQVLDMLTLASQETDVNINTLAETTTNFGVQFRTLGFSLEESIALMSKWEAEGVSVQKVTSGLTIALNTLAKKGYGDSVQAFKDYSKAIKEAKTDTEAITIAQGIFGAKAGADMALAIRDGRFEIDEMVSSLHNADGTLRQTAKEALTLGERFQLAGNQLKYEFIPYIEQMLPYLFQGIELLQKTIGYFKIFGLSVVAAGLKIGEFVQIGYNYLNGFLKFRGAWGSNIVKQVQNIMFNIGVAWNNLPIFMGKGLNKGLEKFNQFANKLISSYNNTIGKVLGNIDGKASFSIDVGGTLQSFKSISDGVEDLSKYTTDAIIDQNKNIRSSYKSEYEKIGNDILGIYSDIDGITDKSAKDRVSNEIKALNDMKKINEETNNLGGGSGGKKAKEEVLGVVDGLKKGLQDAQKELDKTVAGTDEHRQALANVKTQQDALNYATGKGGAIYDQVKNKHTDFATTFKRNTDEQKKFVAELEKQITKLGDEIKKIDGEIAGAFDSIADRYIQIKKELETEGDDFRVRQLQDELLLIESVSDAELLREKERVSGLNETQKLLEKIAILEQQKIDKEKEQGELQAQKEEEERILTEFESKVKALEEKRTNTLATESNKRKELFRQEIAVMQEYIRAMQQLNDMGGGLGGGGGSVTNSTNSTDNRTININANTTMSSDEFTRVANDVLYRDTFR